MRALLLLIGCLCWSCTDGSLGAKELAYQEELAVEAQYKIRRLRQKLNLLDAESTTQFRDLSAQLTKERRDLDNIRLLKKGLSKVGVVKIAALQQEMDDKRAAMKASGAITEEQRNEVARLAQKIQALKKEAFLPVSNQILANGKPLQAQIQDSLDDLERSTDLAEKREIRRRIDDLRALRLQQLERYVSKDLEILQALRRHLTDIDLSALYRNFYREKVEAAYQTLVRHEQELAAFRSELTPDEIEYNNRIRSQINSLRLQQKKSPDPQHTSALQQRIDAAVASLVQGVGHKSSAQDSL